MKSKINKLINFISRAIKSGLRITGRVLKILLLSLVSFGILVIGTSVFISYQIGNTIYKKIKNRKQRNNKIQKENDVEKEIEEKVDLKDDLVTNQDPVVIETVKPYTYQEISDDMINDSNFSSKIKGMLKLYSEIKREIETTNDPIKLENLKKEITLVSFKLQDLLNSDNQTKSEQVNKVLTKTI